MPLERLFETKSKCKIPHEGCELLHTTSNATSLHLGRVADVTMCCWPYSIDSMFPDGSGTIRNFSDRRRLCFTRCSSGSTSANVSLQAALIFESCIAAMLTNLGYPHLHTCIQAAPQGSSRCPSYVEPSTQANIHLGIQQSQQRKSDSRELTCISYKHVQLAASADGTRPLTAGLLGFPSSQRSCKESWEPDQLDPASSRSAKAPEAGVEVSQAERTVACNSTRERCHCMFQPSCARDMRFRTNRSQRSTKAVPIKLTAKHRMPGAFAIELTVRKGNDAVKSRYTWAAKQSAIISYLCSRH